MAFNQLTPLNTPTLSDIISQVYDINQKRLQNEAMKYQNKRSEDTVQSDIDRAIQENLFKQMQAQSGQKLLPSQTDLELAKNQSSKQVLPYSTQEQIAKAQQAASFADLQRKNPLMGEPGMIGVMGAANYLNSLPAGQTSAAQQPTPISSDDLTRALTGMGGTISANTGFYPQQTAQERMPSSSATDPRQQAQILLDMAGANARKNYELANKYGKQNQAFDFNTAPVDVKREMIANARKLGYSPNQAVTNYASGMTYEDMLHEKGISAEDAATLTPINAPTSSNISATKKSKSAVAELDVMDKEISDAIAPYANRYNGLSMKQLIQAIKGEDEDAQARLIAANNLMMESSALRINSAGGQVGEGAIENLTNRAYGKLTILQPTVTPKVFAKAQEYTREWIKKGQQARENSMYNVSPKKEIKSMRSTDDNPLGLEF